MSQCLGTTRQELHFISIVELKRKDLVTQSVKLIKSLEKHFFYVDERLVRKGTQTNVFL